MLVKVGLPNEGEKIVEMVVSEGEIVADRVTLWVVPLARLTFTVADVLLPLATLPLVGLTLTEKSNIAVTVTIVEPEL